MSIPGSDSNPNLEQALTWDIAANDKITNKEKKKYRVDTGSFFKDVLHELGEMYKKNTLVKRHRAEKFRIAAITGDLELIRTAVEDWEIDVNSKNKEGQTAVYCAAREGRFKVVHVLCAEEGADVNLLTETNGRSALWWACYNGDLPIIECLVQHGAKVNQVDQDGRSPLWTAANHNHIPVVKYLLKNGADLDQGDNDGETALWFAAYTGRHKTVAALLKLGADMEKKCKNGKKPLDVALNFQSKQALEKEDARRLSQRKAKRIFEKELEIAMHQSFKRSQSKLLQSNSIKTSLSRQQSRLARNTWAPGTMNYHNDDNDDDDDDDDDDVPFDISSHSFSPKSPSSIHLSFESPSRSSSPSGILTTNKPSPSWDTLKTVKFHSFKISEKDETMEHDNNPRQPDNTPIHTPSFTPIHTPSPSQFHTPIQSMSNSPAISRTSSNTNLDRISSSPAIIPPTNSTLARSTTPTTPTSPLLLSSSPSPSNSPDEIIKKTLYKVELSREQKRDATQMLLQKVQSSRILMKQELDTGKETLEILNKKKEEITQKRLIRQQSRHMRETF